MSLDADLIVDRRRMRRKLTFWRVLAVAVVVIAVIAVARAMSGRVGGSGGRDYVARVTISGLIRGDRDRVEALDRLGRTSAARAVIVHVDSPGGTTAGSEQLMDALTRLKLRKPLVIVVDGSAASGGYITAMAGDHIVAQQTSLVGSIGVLFQFPNVTDLLKTIGVKVEEVKSTPLKAAPNGDELDQPGGARAALDLIVKDSYAWFRGVVQDRRHTRGEALDHVADGRVFTGRQAVELKLIDEIGDEVTAKSWLTSREEHQRQSAGARFSDEQPVRRPHIPACRRLGRLEAGGLSALARRLEEWGAIQAVERLNLDGLLVLWHPPSAN